MRSTITALLILASSMTAIADNTIIATDAYRWQGDSILQSKFVAKAVSPTHIISTYAAQPHFFMPIEQSWQLKNDISAYPQLSSPNKLHQAVFNMGLDEMINAIEPDTTLRTGKEWAGVWTRDVSYSIILSMAALQPEASMISLRKKVNARGVIIQDTGSGGAWPVSSDRMVWILAAWETYKVSGDKKWLEYAYRVGCNSFKDDFATVYAPSGVARGETSFIDWREQSYPKWMQTADIYQSEAMNTNVVHAAAMDILGDMALALGKKKEAEQWDKRSAELAALINKYFYMSDKGYYGMYRYGRGSMILSPREETLGESLAILYDIASPEQQVSITENVPVTPYGPAIFYPQISDMPSYHNNALWPFVASYWTLANAKVGNEQGFLQGMGAVVRPAALFCTNKENLNLDNGDIATELNSSNMLWSLSGNIALTTRGLFGINYMPDGLMFKPFVPQVFGSDTLRMDGYPYRGVKLNITITGYGSKIASLKLNGKVLKSDDAYIPAKMLRGNCDIEIHMANNASQPLRVNNRHNLKSPVTPITRISTATADGAPVLTWNPIEYIAGYIVLKDGKEVGRTRTTTWPLTCGEWQVIGVSSDSTLSFASEPLYYGSQIFIQMPLEGVKMLSKEISYPAETTVTGYTGQGFVEVDHNTPALMVSIEVPEAGVYDLTLRYANGNGPVNTENKCAVRTIEVNDTVIGVVVMPQRGIGNWYDWGLTNTLQVQLPAGKSIMRLLFKPENENMNINTNHALIDGIILRLAN